MRARDVLLEGCWVSWEGRERGGREVDVPDGIDCILEFLFRDERCVGDEAH